MYLLRRRDGSLYTGWTVDLERRVARHGSGVASHYTVKLGLLTSADTP